MPAAPSIAFPFKGSDSASYSGQTIPLDAGGAVPTSATDGALATLGAKADTPATTDAGTFSLIAFVQRGLQRWTALLAALPASLGAKPAAGSFAVVLASDTAVDTVVKAAAISRSGLSTVKAVSAAVTAGGSGYAAGDTVTNAAGVFTVSAVNSGALTAVAATTPVALTATTSGALAQSSTSGSGTGATLTPAYAAAAVQLMAVNASRRGFSVQNQSAAPLWFSGLGAATPDQNSLLLNPGDYFATDSQHVGTGAISIIGQGAGQPFYAREF